jgi:hypothetical protein
MAQRHCIAAKAPNGAKIVVPLFATEWFAAKKAAREYVFRTHDFGVEPGTTIEVYLYAEDGDRTPSWEARVV